MKDWPEDTRIKEIARMDVVRLVRFALEEGESSIPIIEAFNKRAMQFYVQINTVTDIKYRIKSMEENIEALP